MKNKKRINSLRTTKINRILYRIRGFGATNLSYTARLEFYYAPGEWNKGIYTNVKDLENAFKCFRELL